MKNITAEDIDVVIRKHLIKQSELAANFVRNATSEFGTDLDKTLDGSIFTTLGPDDLVLFFMTSTRPGSSNNMTMTENNSTIIQTAAYSVRVMIYGNASTMLANKISARLRTTIVRENLYDDGIYLESVKDCDSIWEFKDNVAWLRTDFKIDIGCEHIVRPVSDDYEIEELSELNTIEELNIR